jgi:hypothetical protein
MKSRIVLKKCIFPMEIFMKENGKIISRMVKEHLFGQTVIFILVSGKITKGNRYDNRNGIGKLTLKSGEIYEGFWLND